MMQKIMFSGQNRLRGYVRDKTLPSSLKKIDSMALEGHEGGDWIDNYVEGSSDPKGEEPKWVEELKWDELFDEAHGDGSS